MPLSDQRRAVTGSLQQRGQCGVLGRKANVSVSRQWLLQTYAQPILIPACDQGHARSRADGGVRVSLKKTHSASRKMVNARSFEIRASVTGYVGVTKIVGENENNVGSPGCRWPRL